MTDPKEPFVHSDANDSTGFLLWQVTALWQRQIAASLKPFGLTQVQFVLLVGLLWLGTKEELVTQIKLAKHTQLDIMMTSQVLRALEKRRLLTRRPHPEDSRAKVLRLTTAGRALVDKALPAVDQTDLTFFSKVIDERSTFNGFLQSLLPQ